MHSHSPPPPLVMPHTNRSEEREQQELRMLPSETDGSICDSSIRTDATGTTKATANSRRTVPQEGPSGVVRSERALSGKTEPAPFNASQPSPSQEAPFLTPEENKAYRRFFGELDPDMKGALPVKALIDACVMLGGRKMKARRQEAESRFMEMDNGDGLVELDEFIIFLAWAKAEGIIQFDPERLNAVAKKHRTQAHSKGTTKEKYDLMAGAQSTSARCSGIGLQTVYDTTLSLVCLYYGCWAPLHLAHRADGRGYWYDDSWAFVVCESLCTLLLFADVFVQTRKRLAEENSNETPWTVGRSVVLDVLAAMPFDLIGWGAGSSELHDVGCIVRLLTLRKIQGLFVVDDVGANLRLVVLIFEVLPIMRGLISTVVCVHVCACLFIAAAPTCGSGGPCPRLDDRYLDAVYWVVYTLSTNGYGDIKISTTAAKFLAITLFATAIVINAFFLQKMRRMMSVDPDGELREAMARTRQLLTLFHIPIHLRDDVLCLQHHILGMKYTLASFGLTFGSLPSAIQDDLSVYIKVRQLMQVSLFQTVSASCQVALANCLFSRVLGRGVEITTKGDCATSLDMITHGWSEVITGDEFAPDSPTSTARGSAAAPDADEAPNSPSMFQVAGTTCRSSKGELNFPTNHPGAHNPDSPTQSLMGKKAKKRQVIIAKRGAFFGLRELLGIKTVYTATVRTVTYTELLQLRKEQFEIVLQRFPALRSHIECVVGLSQEPSAPRSPALGQTLTHEAKLERAIAFYLQSERQAEQELMSDTDDERGDFDSMETGSKKQVPTIRFYGFAGECGEFCSFWPAAFKAGGLEWPSLEHYFQAQKFTSPEYVEEIRCAVTPDDARALGRNRNQPIRVDWMKSRVHALHSGMMAKHSQDDACHAALLGTEGKKLVFTDTTDSFWGIGADGRGQNMFGVLLTLVREVLLKEQRAATTARFGGFTGPRGMLSNSYPVAVAIDGLRYLTVEHYFQAKRWEGTVLEQKILNAATPEQAQRLAWGEGNIVPRDDWEEVQEEVMLDALRAKFSQDPACKKELLKTGNLGIVYASPDDAYWGEGPVGTGANRLGALLEVVRAEIKGGGAKKGRAALFKGVATRGATRTSTVSTASVSTAGTAATSGTGTSGGSSSVGSPLRVAAFVKIGAQKLMGNKGAAEARAQREFARQQRMAELPDQLHQLRQTIMGLLDTVQTGFDKGFEAQIKAVKSLSQSSSRGNYGSPDWKPMV
eukprot:Hpha_TRINITY_DN15371_c1_g9::TRINITY_DN15371_c1_g9_i1::g.92312::m.92312